MSKELFAYLFVSDSTQLPLDVALKTIDTLPEVENWQTILPGAAVLISPLSVDELHHLLKRSFPEQKYILTLLERGRKAGWLARSSWSFMNEPASVTQ